MRLIGHRSLGAQSPHILGRRHECGRMTDGMNSIQAFSDLRISQLKVELSIPHLLTCFQFYYGLYGDWKVRAREEYAVDSALQYLSCT
jgi:hypothetical protein